MPSSPLIDALARDHGWERLPDLEAASVFAAGPGARVLFVPGDPAKNLESHDVAVILPELARAFDGAFRVGVYTAGEDRALREVYAAWATPSLIFLRDGAHLGAIERVRDWSDYLARIAAILGSRSAPEPARRAPATAH